MTEGVRESGHEAERDAAHGELGESSHQTCGRPRKKQAGLCTRPAGWGTVHVGIGACKLHGGIRSTESDRRLKHGRYSTVSNVRVREIKEEIERAGNPLDMTEELTLARALLVDWVDRHAELSDAISAWNHTRRPGERPATVPDLTEIFPAIEVISRMIYRIERLSSDKYIPRGTFYRIMMAMGRAVDLRVHDEAAKEQIRDDWLKIEAV